MRDWEVISDLLIGGRGMTEMEAAKTTFNELRSIERSEYRKMWERWDMARFVAHNQYLLTPCGKGVSKKMDRREWMPLVGDDDFAMRKVSDNIGKVEEWEMEALAEIFGAGAEA